jgi:heat-inducible transcriptional repressor
VRLALSSDVELSERQRDVLRAVVRAYVGEAAPVGSVTISHLLPAKLSSASIRATLAELAEFGLVAQPHTSAGRIPTEEGLRIFIDQLLLRRGIAEYDRRAIAFRVDGADLSSIYHIAAQLLSEQTGLLGFVAVPSLDRVVLQHVSLVRLGSDRVLAVLVSATGSAYRRVLEEGADLEQRELDRIATLLNERVVGRTLRDVRSALAVEAASMRQQADALLDRALKLGSQALTADDSPEDLVIATRLALLDQPEFRDPQRIRDLYEAVETKERLLEVLNQMLEEQGVCVALGGEVDDPALRRCALVASHYGGDARPMGMLGVIGPNRMDYDRVIALVDYFSQVVSEKLSA